MSSHQTIQIADFDIQLVKSQRARHILLKQNVQGEIILTYPRFCPKTMAISFAKAQLPWIRAHIQHAQKEIIFHPNDNIMLLGKNYTIQSGSHGGANGDILYVSGSPDFCHRRVCSLAQKMLLPYIQQKVKELSKEIDVKANRITLRNTSSRWGSCSSKKTLSFCWKIAFAPQEVIDYLIAHEVAHLKEMNHSPRFWSTVDLLIPYRKNAEKWLKTNGRRLQAIR